MVFLTTMNLFLSIEGVVFVVVSDHVGGGVEELLSSVRHLC